MKRTHFPTDPATIQSNLREVSALTSEQLEDLGVYELRELLRKCGIKDVKRGDASTPVRSIKKAEALEALKLAVTPYKLLANATIEPEYVEEDIKRLTYDGVLELLKIAAREESDELRTKKAQAIAYECNEWVTRTYPDTDKLARFYTRCDHRGDYRAQVKTLVKEEGSLLLTAVYGVFADTLSALGRFDAEQKAKANSERLVKYSDTKRTIDTTALKTFAQETLANLSESTPANKWKTVAIALAIVTGRRIYSEILCDTGRYEVAGDYEIRFSGVAKGKELNEQWYTLPTLVLATNVKKAITWLTDKGKRIHCEDSSNWEQVKKARDAADSRYSKDVNKFWKESLCSHLLGLDTNDSSELVKIHGLRKLYVMHFVKGLSDREARARASQLLCHSSDGSVAADAYTSEFDIV